MSTEPLASAAETIGERLKRLRQERGLSQRELASPGVSYAYISRIEAGTRQPSVKALRRLAAKLGVSAGFLETGSQLDPAERRELRLSDLELAFRLGDSEKLEGPLDELADEAVRAGDAASALRARIMLAALAQDRGQPRRAVDLLEAAVEHEPFSPIERIDVYAALGQAYSASGRADQAVSLFERCLDEVAADNRDAALEARYATLLSYALSDMGDLARAEQVVQHALGRVHGTEDPYMRVRLYWSMARLAHHEGRAETALTNVRKAIALLQTTDDTLHLARAHVLAAGIVLSRDDADRAEMHLDQAEHLFGTAPAAQDVLDVKLRRSRIATLRGQAEPAVTLAHEALEAADAGEAPAEQGLAFAALADGLALTGDTPAADDAYRRGVDLLEQHSRWREATHTCRSWARMLRQAGREDEALDVLERATELGLHALPTEAHADR